MRNEYSNAKRSKEQLRQGLMDLLEDGVPFNRITITKLCETSGVNRGTFYNHYRNMKDLAMANISVAWKRPAKKSDLKHTNFAFASSKR